MLKSIDTNDYMTQRPVTFTKDTDIFDAIKIIVDNRLSGATVLDADGNVAGVISEMDFLKAMIHVSYFREGGGTVGDFMSNDCDLMDPHLNLIDAAQELIKTGRRRMPIVDEKGRFAGQISARSILRACLSALDNS